MNAIAEAAKKRAAKLGIQNEEVDETNAGKAGVADPGDLSHPFFGKLKQTGGNQLSPRSRRLAEMNKENEGDAAPAVAQKAPAAPPPPPAPAAPPPPQPPVAAPPAPAKQVDLNAGWSDASAAELRSTVESGQQQQYKDALAVVKRWAGRYDL